MLACPTTRAGVASAIATLLPIHAALAAETQVSSLAASTVAPVFVSASQRQQPILDVQAAVQVITSDELASFAGLNVTEALFLAVGVDARPAGANATVSIRGLNAGAGSPVLLLVDGMRRTSKYGGINPNLLPLESVERIEIVRGPMSALYGSEALGGVINIITRKPGSAASGSGSARVTLGTMEREQRETLTAGATVYLGGGPVQHRLSVEHRRREAFRYDRTTYLADLGRINEQFLNYAGEWTIADQQRLGWTLEGLWQRDTAPGLLAASPPTRPTPTPFTAFERETRHYADIRYTAGLGRGELTLEGAYGRSDAATTRAFPTIEETDFRQTHLRARYAVDIGAHQFTAGVGTARDDLTVTITPSARARTTTHAFLQDEWKVTRNISVLAGLRYDDASDSGDVLTPRASLSFSEGPFTLRAGYGEGFRAPSALELYSRFFRGRFLIVGNPALRPEESKSHEIALSYHRGDASAEAVVFDSRVRNLIQTVVKPRQAGDPPTVSLRSEYNNASRARLKGVEISARMRIAPGFDASLGYDYLDARNTDTGARLTGRARSNLRAVLHYRTGPWQLHLRHRHWFDFYAPDPNARTGPAFDSSHSVTDVRVGYRFGKTTEVGLSIDNVANRRQPINWSAMGSTMEPAGRFYALTLRHAF